MATSTATPAKTEATKTDKPKKTPMPVHERIEGMLKRSAVGGKLTKEHLAKIAELSKSLEVFVG